MTVIDIGNPAIDRATSVLGTSTIIDANNPANASGTITSVEIYVEQTYPSGDVYVAIFDEVDTDTFTARDREKIGTDIAAGYHQYSVNLTVEAGDYIGWYGTTIDKDSGGLGMWFLGGDQTECSSTVFTARLSPDYTNICSIYGESAGEAEANAIFLGTNF